MPFAATDFAAKSARILCVDPDPDIRRSLEDLVQDAGHAVLSASTVNEALIHIHRSSVSLVITRRPLLRLHGADLASRLRAEGILTPVLVLSPEADAPRGITAVGDAPGKNLLRRVNVATVSHAIRQILAEVNGEPEIVTRRSGWVDAAPQFAASVTPGADEYAPVILESLNVFDAERRLIAVALERCSQNRTAAAQLLGIHVRTLRRKLKAMRLNVLPTVVAMES